ncbi:MAG: hypothetical protein M3T56_10250 [Chloroflexota bacterium]|nr:hypothetical protein [Chloroflexota bacterium]
MAIELRAVNSFRRGSIGATYSDDVVTIVNEGAGLVIRREQPTLIHTLIDAMFSGMSEDADHNREALDLATEFAESDWEALRRSDLDQ